jgi:cytochrome c oxidase assembly protein Cox11
VFYLVGKISAHFKNTPLYIMFKMCRTFTYEVVGQRRKLKAIKKIVAQKINVILFLVIVHFNYFWNFHVFSG